MENVITSPLQEVQEWVPRSLQSRIHDEYTRSPKSRKIPTCKDGCAPFAGTAAKRATGRAFRLAHYKTARQWKAKASQEDVICRVLVSFPTKANDLNAEFNELANEWDRETSYLSSTPMIVMHESYQKIMAMGPDVVPLLLQDLKEKRRSWFWALRHLTHANPVVPEDQGNLDKMIAAWLEWGKREGRL